MNTAVLFLVFKRPSVTKRVFNVIRIAKPSRLYIACDGARPHMEAEKIAVKEVREIVSRIDWPCEVKTLFQKQNLGCKRAVVTGIDWFFKQENEGIILEDDCLPHLDFFTFCEYQLQKYRHESRVWSITGDNFQPSRESRVEDYYFSRYSHIWGWATWQRCWQYYDPDLSFWPGWRDSRDFKNHLPIREERRFWTGIFDEVYQGKIDTWDFQWQAVTWRAKGLTVTPTKNLVTNIGFGEGATHTKRHSCDLSIPSTGLKLTGNHPPAIKADDGADKYVFDTIFSGGRNRKHQRRLLLFQLLSGAKRLLGRLLRSSRRKSKSGNIDFFP